MKFLDRSNPQFSDDDVWRIVTELFGIDGDFSALSSERDQNVRIIANDGAQFVLKIAHADEAVGVIDFQTKALQHLAAVAPTLPVPRVVPTVAGEPYTTVTHADGKRHLVRVVTYLAGAVVDHRHSSGELRRNIGRFLAQTDLALRSFFHPSARHEMLWDITQSAQLRPYTKHIRDASARQLIEQTLDHFLTVTMPALGKTRHQVIHADAHGGNLLCDPDNRAQVVGLLDFGDMIYAPLVIELAIAANLRGVSADRMVDAVCHTVSAFDSVLPLEEAEVDLIYDCIMARLAITAVIMAWRDAETPEQPAYHPGYQQEVWQTMRHLKSIGRQQVIDRLRKACRFPVSSESADSDAIYKRRKQVLGQHLRHFYTPPVHFERGSGVWLIGADGRRYLDGYNNVPSVGHCHPHVVRAIARQTGALNTHTRYLYSVIVEYAERLIATMPDDHLNVCTFVNSGSEANDIAWRMAKHVTGNAGAIVMEGAYHGITNAIKPLSPSRASRPNPPHVKTLKCPDLYRESLTVEQYAADVDRAIAELAADGMKPACFMLDSLFVSNGSPTIPDQYVAAVVEKVRAAGGVFIADEVQAGFARSGDEMWGHKLHGVQAEFVTMGKPIGSGYPLGAIVTSAEILNSFVSEVGLFSTFGGNPVACAAGLAVLDVLQQEGLQANAKSTGGYLRDGIRALMPRHAWIGDVRGQGLMAGVEIVRDRVTKKPAAAEATRLINLMRDEGVLISTGGMLGNVLKIRPPLVFQKAHADRMIAALDNALTKL